MTQSRRHTEEKAGTEAKFESIKRPRGIRSPTVLSLNFSGWLLLLCLFLPVCRGCSGGTPKVPVETLSFISPITYEEVLERIIVLGVYGNGALIALTVTFSAWSRNRIFWWRVFCIHVSLTVAIGIAAVGYLFFKDITLKSSVDTLLHVCIPMVVASLWVSSASWKQDRQLMWARFQHLWTLGALLWLHFFCLFGGALMFGYWMTLASSAGMIFSVELARLRIEQDLWDAEQPVKKFQFSIWSLLAWMTFVPLAIAYFQAIGPLIEWLFPS